MSSRAYKNEKIISYCLSEWRGRGTVLSCFCLLTLVNDRQHSDLKEMTGTAVDHCSGNYNGGSLTLRADGL